MRLCLLTICCLLPLRGLCATYYVRSDGSAANKAAAVGPASDATKAMSVTVFNGETFSDDDVIYFSSRGGTYTNMAVVIPSGGSSSAHLITYAGEPSFIPTFDGTNATDTIVAVNSKNNLEIRDFTVTRPATSGFDVYGTSAGVVIRNAISTYSGNQAFQNRDTASVTYSNIVGSNCVDDGFSMHDSSVAVVNTASFATNSQGINIINSASLTLLNVSLSNNDQAIVPSNASQIVGTNITITLTNSINGIGVFLTLADGGSPTHSFNNLTINGTSGHEGIYIDSSGGSLAINGLTDNSTAPKAVFLDAGTIAITGFLFNGTYSGSVIDARSNSPSITLDQGVIDASHTTSHVIDLEATSSATLRLYRSVVKDMASAKYAVACRTGATLYSYNNVFYDSDKNGKGLFCQGTVTAKNNAFDNLDVCIAQSAGAPTVDYNAFFNYNTKTSGTVTSTHEITSDPKFVSVPGSFHLLASSPLINAGTSVGLWSSGLPDIGAYEYQVVPVIVGARTIPIP